MRVAVGTKFDTEPRRPSPARRPVWFIFGCASFFLAAWFLLYFFPIVQVRENSMSPTLRSGDMVLLSRLAYVLERIEPGDVLVFGPAKTPAPHSAEPALEMIKRCVLLPGMPLTWDKEKLYIPYLQRSVAVQPPVREHLKTLSRIPEGYIFVLGDNAADSVDSRSYGLVPLRQVHGKALWF